MKKKIFKKIIKKACQQTAFKFLMQEKETKSKLDNLDYKELKLQNYFKAKLYFKKQSLLFNFRTQMINVSKNYGRIILCPLCLKGVDDQKHLMSCEKLLLEQEPQVRYDDIFGNNSKKNAIIAELAYEKVRMRKKLLSKN